MLQRVGLRDTLFIAMSNDDYEEKAGYLNALAETRALSHDLTPFLKFAPRESRSNALGCSQRSVSTSPKCSIETQ